MTHHDLIHRMADELDHYRQLVTDDRREVHPLAVEARAVLAQPEPEVVGPSDEELEAFLLDVAAEQGDIYWAEPLVLARAVLSHYGRPAPAPAGERQAAPVPVAVSDRLPQPEDCDAEGRCWWWRTDDADEWWEFLCITDAREYNAGCGSARYTHWLPAHALPLPGGEVEDA